jgi:hypothetical protein
MRGEARIVRTDWEATKRKPVGWRSETIGWGLIDFHLEGWKENRITCSHTNHNTEKRVLAREEFYFDRLGPASAWDWKTITSISSKINRFIRKTAPAKSGPLPIMPAAYRMIGEGAAELIPR